LAAESSSSVKTIASTSQSQPSSQNQSSQINEAYDLSAVRNQTQNFLNISKDLGNADLEKMSEIVGELLSFHEKLVQLSAQSRKPKEDTFAKIKNFIQEKIAIIDKNYVAPKKN